MDDQPRGRREFGRGWVAVISGSIGALIAGLTIWWLLGSGTTRQETEHSRDQSSPQSPDATAPSPNEAAPEDSDGGGCECSENCQDACEQKFKDIIGQIWSGMWEAFCGSASGNVTVSGTAATALAGVMVAPLFVTRKLRLSSRDDGSGIATHATLWAIGIYQRRVAPHTAVRCRFRPSCSRYGYRVIARYGLLRGSGLAVARIRRCSSRIRPGTPDPPP